MTNTAIQLPQDNDLALHTHHSESLTDILEPKVDVALWSRPYDLGFSDYFIDNFNTLKIGLREVIPLSKMREVLMHDLPDGSGKKEVVEDIYMLSDMLTCLFDCEQVGLRLSAMNKAMCPRFHHDNIPVRLLCTYLGAGTQWLPAEKVNYDKLGHKANGAVDATSDLYACESDIHQANQNDVVLLKGAAWNPATNYGAIHRSCELHHNEMRVLLSLDPM